MDRWKESLSRSNAGLQAEKMLNMQTDFIRTKKNQKTSFAQHLEWMKHQKILNMVSRFKVYNTGGKL